MFQTNILNLYNWCSKTLLDTDQIILYYNIIFIKGAYEEDVASSSLIMEDVVAREGGKGTVFLNYLYLDALDYGGNIYMGMTTLF